MGWKSKEATWASQSGPSCDTSTCRAANGGAACRCAWLACVQLDMRFQQPGALQQSRSSQRIPMLPSSVVPIPPHLLQLLAGHDVRPRPHPLQRCLELLGQHVLVLAGQEWRGRGSCWSSTVSGHSIPNLGLQGNHTARLCPPQSPAATSSSPTGLDAEHLPQLERSAAHAAQRIGQPLGIVLGHEGGVGAGGRRAVGNGKALVRHVCLASRLGW